MAPLGFLESTLKHQVGVACIVAAIDGDEIFEENKLLLLLPGLLLWRVAHYL